MQRELVQLDPPPLHTAPSCPCNVPVINMGELPVDKVDGLLQRVLQEVRKTKQFSRKGHTFWVLFKHDNPVNHKPYPALKFTEDSLRSWLFALNKVAQICKS